MLLFFTAGIGENSTYYIRKLVCTDIVIWNWTGCIQNEIRSKAIREINTDDSTKILVIPTNEIEIAKQVLNY
jgi:acetate kinase